MICWQISLGAILEADYHILSKSGKKHWQHKTSVFCLYYKVRHRRILKIIHILAFTCSSSPPQPFCFSGSDITTCSWPSFLHSVPLLNSGKTGRQPVAAASVVLRERLWPFLPQDNPEGWCGDRMVRIEGHVRP